MSDRFPVAGHPNLVKNRHGVVSNTDTEGYRNAVAAREAALKKQETIKDLTSRVNTLETLVEKLLNIKTIGT